MTSPFYKKVESKMFEYKITNNDNYMIKNYSVKQRIDKFIKSDFGQRLIKRLKSFLWATIMMCIAGIADILAQEVGNVNMGNSNMILLGLILSQISKYLNNKYRLNK